MLRSASLGSETPDGWLWPEDDGGRVVLQRALHDLARIDRRAVDRAAKQLLVADQPMPRVEEQAAKHLVRQVEQPRLEEAGRIERCREGAARIQRAPRDSGGRARARPASRATRAGPSPCARASSAGAAAEQRREAAPCARAGRARAPRRSAPRSAGAEQHGEQLAVGQGAGARLEQPFARPFRSRPMVQAHRASPRREGSPSSRRRGRAAHAISPRRHKKSSNSQWHRAQNRE